MPHNLLASSTDYYGIFSDLDPADEKWWATARDFGVECLKVINEDWEIGRTNPDLVRALGDRDLFTDGVEIPGHEVMSPLAAGLVAMEISRADGSMGAVAAVQGGLVMRSIMLYGSQQQQETYIEKLARGEIFGAFGLTEPDHGSDAVALETTAVLDGDDYVLNGQKRWIGFGANGHLTIIWARLEDGGVGGFLVSQTTPNYQAEIIKGKGVLRAIDQSLITLKDVRVPAENRLPGVSSFKDVSKVLSATRSGVAWAALGHAIACYEIALEHAKTRTQFGKPLVKFQIIQQRLSEMLQEITSMALHCKQLAVLEAAGHLVPEQASMAKGYCTKHARIVAANARDMLGGSGILLENHIIRHMGDLEALHTYEGTETIQHLIVGRKITGTGAFA